MKAERIIFVYAGWLESQAFVGMHFISDDLK